MEIPRRSSVLQYSSLSSIFGTEAASPITSIVREDRNRKRPSRRVGVMRQLSRLSYTVGWFGREFNTVGVTITRAYDNSTRSTAVQFEQSRLPDAIASYS